MPSTPSSARRWEQGALLLLGIGAAIRIASLAHDPGLRLDESKLALEIGLRSPLRLLDPLDYGQAAPPAFLLVEKLLFELSDGAPWLLRLLPVAASLLALWLLRRLAAALLPSRAVCVAAGLVAFAPALVGFSWQVKPYAVDALVAVVLLSLALPVVRPGAGSPSITRLGVAGVAAVTASIPAAFVLAGVGLAALWRRWPERRTRVHLLGWSAAWALTFAATLRVYPATATGSFLHEYWRGAFLDPAEPVAAAKLGARLMHAWFLEGSTLLPSPAGALALAVLAMSGIIWFIRRGDRAVLALLAAPLVLVAVASGLERWPLAGRLTLFALPAVAIMIAAGIELIGSLSRLGPSVRVGLAGAVILVPALAAGPRALFRTYAGEEAAARFARAHRGPAPVYIAPRALPNWLYYSTDWSRPDRERLRLAARVVSPGGVSSPNLSPADLAAVAATLPPPRRYRQYLEIWGRSSGVNDGYTEILDSVPTPDWAPAEVERVRALDADTVWLYLWNVTALERRTLLQSFEAAGLRPVDPGGAVVGVIRESSR